ncbi:MAG: hypothetical protein ACRD8A_12210 [Candidatus Acidiferrales bacterium]
MNLKAAFILLIALITFAASRAKGDQFTVTVDTSSFAGLPQNIGFALTSGDDALNNTVVLSGFNFGGGSLLAGTEDCSFGGFFSGSGCSGNLSSGVTLTETDFTDSDFTAFFTQQFNTGNSLSFSLDTTNNHSGGDLAFPDQLAMYVCVDSSFDCFTDDGTGAMLELDLTGDALSPASFTLSGSEGGEDQYMPAPVVTADVPTTATPEPSSLVLWFLGLSGIIVLSGARKYNESSRLMGPRLEQPDHL